jgi:hypothetical protein
MKTAEQVIYEMLTECTGTALCDSGGAYGRNWEKNQGKTLEDFQREPEVFVDREFGTYTISVFHYLTKQLGRDHYCEEFDSANVASKDWDGDTYGVSKAGQAVLDKYNAKLGNPFNSYNGEDFLSQVIQGTICELLGRSYVLLQLHGGCDVRGGYTDARMFEILSGDEYLQPQSVFGYIDGEPVGNSYDGYHLRRMDSDEIVEITKDNDITLLLEEW